MLVYLISIICLHSPFFLKKKKMHHLQGLWFGTYSIEHSNVSSVYFLKHYICHYEEMSYVFFFYLQRKNCSVDTKLFSNEKKAILIKEIKTFNLLILFLLKFGRIKKIGFYAVLLSLNEKKLQKVHFFKI